MIRREFNNIRHGAETAKPNDPSLFGERVAKGGARPASPPPGEIGRTGGASDQPNDIREIIAARYYLARSAPGATWPDDASDQQKRVAFGFAENLVADFAVAYCNAPLTLETEIPPAKPLKLSWLERFERIGERIPVWVAPALFGGVFGGYVALWLIERSQ